MFYFSFKRYSYINYLFNKRDMHIMAFINIDLQEKNNLLLAKHLLLLTSGVGKNVI